MAVRNKVYTYLGINPGSKLPSSVDGGYPLMYFDLLDTVLCPDCANKHEEYSEPIVDCDVNWEEVVICEDCGNRIPQAY